VVIIGGVAIIYIWLFIVRDGEFYKGLFTFRFTIKETVLAVIVCGVP